MRFKPHQRVNRAIIHGRKDRPTQQQSFSLFLSKKRSFAFLFSFSFCFFLGTTRKKFPTVDT